MKMLPTRVLGFAVTLMLASGASYADPDSADVQASNNPNIGGMSTLFRHSDGIGMTASVTGLRGGDVA